VDRQLGEARAELLANIAGVEAMSSWDLVLEYLPENREWNIAHFAAMASSTPSSRPNPSEAADGKRQHALAIDEPAAAVVRRIFAEFLAGYGIYAIAARLTADGIACPSAHDPRRNQHRRGLAWSKSAVRAILMTPRYTGRQVWNRQRKDEVLIDVTDVALGHTTKMRWNDQGKWIFSDEVVHPPLVDTDTFRRPSCCSRPKRPQDSPPTALDAASLHPARPAILRVPAADARQLEQRSGLLPLHLSQRIRAH
jgi:Recombinase